MSVLGEVENIMEVAPRERRRGVAVYGPSGLLNARNSLSATFLSFRLKRDHNATVLWSKSWPSVSCSANGQSESAISHNFSSRPDSKQTLSNLKMFSVRYGRLQSEVDPDCHDNASVPTIPWVVHSKTYFASLLNSDPSCNGKSVAKEKCVEDLLALSTQNPRVECQIMKLSGTKTKCASAKETDQEKRLT